MIVALYVGHTSLASNDDKMIKSEKAKLCARFEMEDQGLIHYCLGMSVKRDKEAKVQSISQKAYLKNVLQWFGMCYCKPLSTLMEPGKKYDMLSNDQDPIDIQRYQAANQQWESSVSLCPDLVLSIGQELNVFFIISKVL